jgi:phosphatidate cytidylyltransferase
MSEGATRTAPVGARERSVVHPRPPTPASEPPKRKASNLALRLLTAVLLIPPVLWIIYQGGVFVLATVIVIALLGLNEFYQMIEQKGAEPLRGQGMVAAAALPVVMYFGAESLATVLMTVVLLTMMVVQLTKNRISEALASISGTFFGVFYVGWLLSHTVVLRQFSQVVAARWPEVAAGMHPEVGGFYLVFTISVVIAGDAGAYFAGRAYGRRKLAPRISPGKTVEGALGAVVAGTLLGVGLKAGFDLWAPDLSSLELRGGRPDRLHPHRGGHDRRPDRVAAEARRPAEGHRHPAAGHGRRARPDRLEPDRDPRDVLPDARLHVPDGRLSEAPEPP